MYLEIEMKVVQNNFIISLGLFGKFVNLHEFYDSFAFI